MGDVFTILLDNGELKSLLETVDGCLGYLCSLERLDHNLGEAGRPKRMLPGVDGGLLGDAKGLSRAGVQLVSEARVEEARSNRR